MLSVEVHREQNLEKGTGKGHQSRIGRGWLPSRRGQSKLLFELLRVILVLVFAGRV